MALASPWLLHQDANVFDGSHQFFYLTSKGLDLLLHGFNALYRLE